MPVMPDNLTGTGLRNTVPRHWAVSRSISVTAFFLILTMVLIWTTMAVDVPTTGSVQTAFNGAHPLPGLVEAEDFDNGGPGVAYFDTTVSNRGGAYRTNEGVDIESQGAITNLAYIVNNEWTEYTVVVGVPGTYTMDFRVGSWNNGRQIVVSVDSVNVATVNVPNVGGYEAFETVSASIPLSSGSHVIRLTFVGDGQNLDWFRVREASTDNSPVQTAYNGPHLVPGRVEAEDYDCGGSQIAYNDTTPANTGNSGRMSEGVDVVFDGSTTAISWVYDGEWTEYTVEVASSGYYALNLRVGSPGPGQKINVTVDGTPGCSVTVPMTGSYSTFTTVSGLLNLTPGTHVIRLTYRVEGYGLVIDWIEFLGGSPTSVKPTVTSFAPATFPTTIPTTFPTAFPTTFLTTIPTANPITNPTTIAPATFPTISSGMSATQAGAIVSSLRTESYNRLASKQSAARSWTIPSRPDLVAIGTNVRLRGLKSDGVTDNTVALQALLNSLPSGATLYFPAGTYRIDGPVSVDKPVTIFGESGTVFNCRNAVKNVFIVNRYGSAGSKMNGVVFTGIVFEGPGNESDPAMIDAYYLTNLRVSYIKFHNLGYAGIRVNTCSNSVIDNCVFDNIFKTGTGYGVCITDRSDGIVVRDSFFITKGRHGITTGTSNPYLSSADYIRGVTVENNYFEFTTRSATDTHDVTWGPIVVKNNVYYRCEVGVGLRGGVSEIADNTMIECTYGVYVYDLSSAPSTIESRVNSIVRNRIFDGLGDGMVLKYVNSYVAENIIDGQDKSVGQIGIYVDNSRYTPTSFRIERNIVDDCRHGVYVLVPSSAISLSSNYKI